MNRSEAMEEALAEARRFVIEAAKARRSILVNRQYVIDPNTTLAKIDAALSAPPRNCDVGTAEEKKKRFQDFCDDSQVDEDYTSMCARCTLRREKHCELAWEQMPYEEGGAK